MNAARPLPVRPGTADQLARIAHFSAIEPLQPEELDAVALFLIGDVGDTVTRIALWENLREDCLKLWSLVASDWDTDDLDEIPEKDWTRYSFATWQQEEDRRYEITRDRLTDGIENLIRLSREAVAEARRNARTAVA